MSHILVGYGEESIIVIYDYFCFVPKTISVLSLHTKRNYSIENENVIFIHEDHTCLKSRVFFKIIQIVCLISKHIFLHVLICQM